MLQLHVKGMTQADAWRRATGSTKAKQSTAAEKASRIFADPRVIARIEQLRAKTDAKTILSVNDRLAILARDAQVKGNSAPLINARARVIDVYTKIAGGAQPEQSEVTIKGDPNAPIAVAVTVHRSPVRDRLAALRAAKEARS